MGVFSTAQQTDTGPVSATLNGGVTFGRGSPSGNKTLTSTTAIIAVAVVLVALIYLSARKGGRGRGGG